MLRDVAACPGPRSRREGWGNVVYSERWVEAVCATEPKGCPTPRVLLRRMLPALRQPPEDAQKG